MPTEIWTATDLDNVRNNLSGEYVQMADIDLSGYANWVPIGGHPTEYWTSYGFEGKYYGNQYKISGLKYTDQERFYIGLFSWLHADAIVEGVELRGVDIHESVNSDTYAGGLAGWNYGTVRKCSSIGTVKSTIATGGLLGRNVSSGGSPALIEDCYTAGYVGVYTSVGGTPIWIKSGGGLTTWNVDGTVRNCYSYAVVDFADDGYGSWYYGGLLAENDGGTVINSYYDQEVSGQSDTGKGEPRTTAEMTYEPATNTYVDWDFDAIWTHDKGYTVNNGYPYLWVPYMVVYPKVAGAWKSGPAWIKKDGQWKAVTQGWIKEGGAWKPIIP